MARMNMVQALNSAMDVMLERDPRVVILGEDVGYFGGVFRVTEGLQRKYGEHRVLDTPVAEGGIVAAAIGMGVNGLKPVAEVQFADYIYPGFDPVVFFEPKRIYNGPFDGDPHKPAVPWSAHPRGEVPEGHYTVPIGRAEVVREGGQASVLTYGTMVHVAEAAVRLAGVDAEIIDVRTMSPLDVETLCTSVCKTGRCVVVHEATRFSGYGAELVATVQEECFWNLEAPIQRVTGWDTPYPHAFEWEYFPGPARIAAALKQVTEAA